jgi:hypothetical protein
MSSLFGMAYFVFFDKLKQSVNELLTEMIKTKKGM